MNLKLIYTLFLVVLGINSSGVAGNRENLQEPDQVKVEIKIRNRSTFKSRSFLEEKLPLPSIGTAAWFKSRVQTDHYYLHFIGNDPNNSSFSNACHEDFTLPPPGNTYSYSLWIRSVQLKNLSVAFLYKQDYSPTYAVDLLNLSSMSLMEFESQTFNVPVDLTLPEPLENKRLIKIKIKLTDPLEVEDKIVQASTPKQTQGPVANVRFIYGNPLSLLLKTLGRALDYKAHSDITFVTGKTP